MGTKTCTDPSFAYAQLPFGIFLIRIIENEYCLVVSTAPQSPYTSPKSPTKLTPITLRLTIRSVGHKETTIAGETMEELCSSALHAAEKKKKLTKKATPSGWQVMSDGNADWTTGTELDEDSFHYYCKKQNTRILLELK